MMVRRLLASVPVVSDQGQRKRQTIKHEQPSSTPVCQRLNAIMTRWHRLIQIARNPYRPERHYMRGPGPKWYAKHQGMKPRRLVYDPSSASDWVAAPNREKKKTDGNPDGYLG